MTTQDIDVEMISDTLVGHKVLVGISGGIASVDSVRLLRELRRHGAELIVIMTHSAQEIISPLAIQWASQSIIITDWESDMGQLELVTSVLDCPATRNTIASHLHGIMDSPLQMALSAARGRGIPTLFVPSMHESLSDDPVTKELCDQLIDNGSDVFWGQYEEGRMKQPSVVDIVAKLAHIINSRDDYRKRIVITLGSTKCPIDSVRWIQNTSSGKTGLDIANYLFRQGHDIIIVAGDTKVSFPKYFDEVIYESDPNIMLQSLISIAHSNRQIDAWIHCAAVLDYVPIETSDIKIKSGDEEWIIKLVPSTKHIQELGPVTNGSNRIGFKLESNYTDDELISSAITMMEKYDLNGVVANHLKSIQSNQNRAFWVDKEGQVTPLNDNLTLAKVIHNHITA